MHPNGNHHLLHIEDLYVVYDDKVVLDNIDLAVSSGELCTVVGPSGCGKSTLLRTILGEERPTSGDILINGEPVGFPNQSRGIVYQRYSLMPNLTAVENVKLGPKLCQSPWDYWSRGKDKEIHAEAMSYLEKVRLPEHADKYPHELSGGQQQRVAIAQALIMKPMMILMDEPFGALDPATRQRAQIFLLELWQEFNMTVFFVTHEIEEAVYLGTRILVLSPHYSDGRGGNCASRGSKIIADYPLPRTASSTVVKDQPEFRSMVNAIMQEGFNPKYLKHVNDFNLKHADSFQTLKEEEAQK